LLELHKRTNIDDRVARHENRHLAQGINDIGNPSWIRGP